MFEDLHDDDAPVGRILTRREALVLLGGAGAAGLLMAMGCSPATGGVIGTSGSDDTSGSSTSCTAKPALTEGPYFVDERLNRSDIRSDTATGAVKAGSLLALTFNLSRIQSGACTPLAGAQVDVWHCDALGVYSDVIDAGFNTTGQNWLRGYRVSNSSGVSDVTTILPGWYAGRATHIHFKVRGTSTSGSAYDFTSQLFFGESFLSSAYVVAPYSSKSDSGRLRNASDGIYNQGGSQLVVTPSASGGTYAATVNIALNV